MVGGLVGGSFVGRLVKAPVDLGWAVALVLGGQRGQNHLPLGIFDSWGVRQVVCQPVLHPSHKSMVSAGVVCEQTLQAVSVRGSECLLEVELAGDCLVGGLGGLAVVVVVARGSGVKDCIRRVCSEARYGVMAWRLHGSLPRLCGRE